MSEKTLKFDNIRVYKKKIHKSKQPTDLYLRNLDQIRPDKFKHSDDGFKYFAGYKEGQILKLLCIILPQMSGYIKLKLWTIEKINSQPVDFEQVKKLSSHFINLKQHENIIIFFADFKQFKRNNFAYFKQHS